MTDVSLESRFRGTYYRSLSDAQRRAESAPAETALEPLLPIIDSHHHLVDGAHGRYMLPEYLADTAVGHNIRETIFVESAAMYRTDGPEAMRTIGETEFAARIAARSAGGPGPRIGAGIVAAAALSLGDEVADVLEAQVEAGRGYLKGVRDLVQWDGSEIGRYSTRRAPPHKLMDSAFRRGAARLAGLGLSLDVWVFHPQIPELIDLADAFPETQIILDHVGTPLGVGPYRRDTTFVQWRSLLEGLARRANVAVKLGGLAMPYTGFDFHVDETPPTSAALADAWKPYLDTCIELFGVTRCMFESNFPADKQTCSYGVLWNAFKRVAAGYTPAEKAALFYETARRVYRLPAA
jgi:L-fuconolactonase